MFHCSELDHMNILRIVENNFFTGCSVEGYENIDSDILPLRKMIYSLNIFEFEFIGISIFKCIWIYTMKFLLMASILKTD